MVSGHRRLIRPNLPQPRLLPITIVAMSALLAVKSIILVQAAAEEAGAPGQTQAGPSGMVAPTPQPAPKPGRVMSAPPMSTGAANTSSAGGTAPSANTVPPVSEAERSILLDLRRRRAQLDERAHTLDQREADLNAVNRRLDERVQQLSALQTKLENLEASRKQHGAENWAGLVKVYEAMKPREAAAIFDVLDMQVLLQVLDRMQERRAAPVLAAMQPDRARLATQLLAEMRTRAVTADTGATPTAMPQTAGSPPATASVDPKT